MEVRKKKGRRSQTSRQHKRKEFERPDITTSKPTIGKEKRGSWNSPWGAKGPKFFGRRSEVNEGKRRKQTKRCKGAPVFESANAIGGFQYFKSMID